MYKYFSWIRSSQVGEVWFCYHGVVMRPAKTATWRYEETSAEIRCGYSPGCPETEEDAREATWNRDAPTGTRESNESEVQQLETF